MRFLLFLFLGEGIFTIWCALKTTSDVVGNTSDVNENTSEVIEDSFNSHLEGVLIVRVFS